MRPDPFRRDDTKAWLSKTHTDLRSAGADMQAQPAILDDALFHCQQAVEKALKGFLTWHDRPFRKSHDWRELGKECVLIDPSLETVLMPALHLMDYAWKFRYPGAPGEPTLEEAQESLSLAREVANAISSRLPTEVLP